jgi:hypothetical protein
MVKLDRGQTRSNLSPYVTMVKLDRGQTRSNLSPYVTVVKLDRGQTRSNLSPYVTMVKLDRGQTRSNLSPYVTVVKLDRAVAYVPDLVSSTRMCLVSRVYVPLCRAYMRLCVHGPVRICAGVEPICACEHMRLCRALVRTWCRARTVARPAAAARSRRRSCSCALMGS